MPVHGCTSPWCVNPYHKHENPSPMQRVIEGLDPVERTVYCAKCALAGLRARNPEICARSLHTGLAAGRSVAGKVHHTVKKLERVDRLLLAGENQQAECGLIALLLGQSRRVDRIDDRLNAAHEAMREAA